MSYSGEGRYDRWGGGSSSSNRRQSDEFYSEERSHDRSGRNSSSSRRHSDQPYSGEGRSYDRWGGSRSRNSDAGGRDPYAYDAGRSHSSDRHSASRRSSGSASGKVDPYAYERSGGSRREEEMTREEYDMRVQAAYRRMEESSYNSLRTLNETVDTGIHTTEELERQAETLDRVDARLDEMDVDLGKAKKSMRVIKSPFGGIANYFSRRKKVDEIIDPKTAPPVPKGGATGRGPAQQQKPAKQYASSGSKVVDRNMDEMEKALHQLKGIGELISDQLDDSEVQIERIKVKVDRNEVKIKNLNKDIKREL